jgi:Tfp pilus assembly protein PilF
MGDLARALVGLERVLADQRELLGADHPEALDTAGNYGSVLVELGRVDEGERVFRETLETQRRVLGADHVATAASEVNLAGVCSSRGQLAEAVALYEHALGTRRTRLGADHPDTRAAEERLELARGQLADARAAARAEQ